MSDVKHADKRAETHSCVCERTETHGDLISRKSAIDSLGEEPEVWCGDTGEYAVREQWRADVSAIKAVPSAESESCDMCDFCDGLESGDKLFQISDWDGGIGFDYIYIKYCPMCGRKL